MHAWLKREKHGRVYPGDSYVESLASLRTVAFEGNSLNSSLRNIDECQHGERYRCEPTSKAPYLVLWAGISQIL
jgi:hypothetical protein